MIVVLVDAVQALHARQSVESSAPFQVVLGHNDDLAHELAICEARPDLLEQFSAMRRFEPAHESIALRRQERDADTQRG